MENTLPTRTLSSRANQQLPRRCRLVPVGQPALADVLCYSGLSHQGNSTGCEQCHSHRDVGDSGEQMSIADTIRTSSVFWRLVRVGHQTETLRSFRGSQLERMAVSFRRQAFAPHRHDTYAILGYSEREYRRRTTPCRAARSPSVGPLDHLHKLTQLRTLGLLGPIGQQSQ